MGIRQVFDPKLDGETKAYVFTFPVPVGITIGTTSTVMTVYSGVDASPSSMLLGSPVISGNTITQLVRAGVIGVIYILRCAASMNDGQGLEQEGYLAVISA